MNTLRDNLDQRIKKQIGEREIAPSRDLWAEIEIQTAAAPSKFKMNRILAAACVILAFGLGFVLFFNKEKASPEANITKVKPEQIQKETPAGFNKETAPAFAEKEKNIIQENNRPVEIIKEIPASKALAEDIKTLSVKQNAPVIAPAIPQIPVEKIIAKAEDSSKIPGKKKRYVDPSTLLFSVEHKDVIQKTKQSNVASIDLNGK